LTSHHSCYPEKYKPSIHDESTNVRHKREKAKDSNMKFGLVGFALLGLSSTAKAFSKNPHHRATAKATVSKTSSSLFMSSSTGTDFYSLSGVQSDGSAVSASDFKGKVVYATNVASQ